MAGAQENCVRFGSRPASPIPNAFGPARSGSPPSLPPASSCAPAGPGGRARRRGRPASAPGGTRGRRASCRTNSRRASGAVGILRPPPRRARRSANPVTGSIPALRLVGACATEPKGEAGAEGRQREVGCPGRSDRGFDCSASSCAPPRERPSVWSKLERRASKRTRSLSSHGPNPCATTSS